ncbi:MAG: chorismate synthase [Chloroflexi bacterium]|nr:chorismate synthase [Chloroflexota bacterium]
MGSVTADIPDDMTLRRPLRRRRKQRHSLPVPAATEAMRQTIYEIMRAKDTIGGVFEVVALGAPVGLGSHVHWDRRLDALLMWAVASIHAIKGVEIGPAFANAALPGSQVHDEIFLAADGQTLVRQTNRSGGFEGGITTGEPIIVRAAMKPSLLSIIHENLWMRAERKRRYRL